MVKVRYNGSPDPINAAEIWQYDYGQTLCIEDVPNIGNTVEVHFSVQKTGGTALEQVAVVSDGTITARIPDSLLDNNDITHNYKLFAFVYPVGFSGAETIIRIVIPVISRPKPQYHDTPASELTPFDAIAAQVGEDAETAREAADQATQSASAAAASASAAATSETAAAQSASSAADSAGQAETSKNLAEFAADHAAQSLRAAAEKADEAAASATSAEQSKTAAVDAATGAAQSESAARQSAIDAKASETAAAQSADKAEQAAANAGYMFFHIDSNGHLIYERTDNVDVDFALSDGHLYMEVA